MHHAIVLGTRPEIIKLSPLIRLLEKKDERFTLIDTGQHYDYEMSKIFYDELNLPQPSYKFTISKENPNSQIGTMLTELLKLLTQLKPDIIYSQGDTNSVLAAALAAQRNLIPFGHVEAGIRSYDLTMPEEVNRRVASVCASLHFCPTNLAAQNLRVEGIDPYRIEVTGNTIVDAVMYYLKNTSQINLKLDHTDLIQNKENFLILTLHRPATVDNKVILTKIISTLIKLPLKILFLIHPRTNQRIKDFNLHTLIEKSNIILNPPIGYFEFLSLIQKSYGIITDSGGIQEEATTLQVPCIVLRPNTERPEAIIAGINKLINPFDPNFEKKLQIEILSLMKLNSQSILTKNPFGDGNAAEKILACVLKTYEEGELSLKTPDQTTRYPELKLVNNINFNSDQIQIGFNNDGAIISPNEYSSNGKYFLKKVTHILDREKS